MKTLANKLGVVLQETLKELLNLFVKFRPHSEGSMMTLLPNPVRPDYFTFTFFTHFYNENIQPLFFLINQVVWN